MTTTINTITDLRDYLDARLPFLRAERRLDEATDAIWLRAHGPMGVERYADRDDPWGVFVTITVGYEGHDLRDLIGARVHGFAAIEWAEAHGCDVCKYADPARDDLSPAEAREVAAIDPSLVYVTGVDTCRVHRCHEPAIDGLCSHHAEDHCEHGLGPEDAPCADCADDARMDDRR